MAGKLSEKSKERKKTGGQKKRVKAGKKVKKIKKMALQLEKMTENWAEKKN